MVLAAILIIASAARAECDLICPATGASISVGSSDYEIPYMIAIIAGAISVLSPCSLPLLLGYMTAMSKTKRSLVSGTLAFFAGLCLVWVFLGFLVSGVGSLLLTNVRGLHALAGMVMVVFGIFYFLGIGLPMPKTMRMVKVNTLGMFLFGVLFTLAWAPCAGPILGGILMMALGQSAFAGASLLFAYALGFMLTAIVLFIVIEKVGKKLHFNKEARVAGRDFALINVIGGILLINVGILYLSGMVGVLADISAPITNTIVGLEGEMLENPTPYGAGAVAIILISAYLLLRGKRKRKSGKITGGGRLRTRKAQGRD